jgi:hypothetical protein
LSILIIDKKLLTQALSNGLADDMQDHDYDQRNQFADWLLANQLTKDKTTIAMMASGEHNTSPLFRRIFWYYQGRLRWSRKAPPDNTLRLLASLKTDIAEAELEVQWAMNFAAA